MQDRYWMFQRNAVFYLEDKLNGNLTTARAYLSAKSPEMLSRTWGEIMDDMAIGYKGSTRQRWVKVVGASITNVFSCGRCRVTLLNTGLVKTYMGLPGQNG